MSLEAHLKQIRAHIDDPAPYLVLADWLQEQGNPWGRLIMLQHELEQRPGDSAIATEADALLRKHKWAPKHKPELLRLDWRWGFIRGIRVFDEYASANLDEVLSPVLALPMAALVRSCLIFREPEHVDDEAPSVLNRLPAGAVVEHVGPLTLHDEDPEERLASLRAASPDTRWVDVHHEVPVELVRFKRLTMLTCQGVAALPAELAELPLERIDVDWCGELTSIPDAVWSIESLGHISMYDCYGLGLNMGQVNNLLLGFVRARTPRKQRILEAALMRGGSPRASTEQLLYALDSNVGAVRTRALELLARQLQSPLGRHPIQPGSVWSRCWAASTSTARCSRRASRAPGRRSRPRSPTGRPTCWWGRSPGASSTPRATCRCWWSRTWSRWARARGAGEPRPECEAERAKQTRPGGARRRPGRRPGPRSTWRGWRRTCAARRTAGSAPRSRRCRSTAASPPS